MGKCPPFICEEPLRNNCEERTKNRFLNPVFRRPEPSMMDFVVLSLVAGVLAGVALPGAGVYDARPRHSSPRRLLLPNSLAA